MKSILGAFVALTLALGMSGFAYACWSQTLYIEGEVETGEVCVGYVYTDSWDEEYLGKDVGDIDCWLEDEKGEHDEDPIYETLVIELSNVYPSYGAYIEVWIANGGSIPVDLVDFDIELVSDPEGLLDFVDWEIIDCNWPRYPQIDPCDVVGFWVHIHIMQEVDLNGNGTIEPDEICPQNATATFEGYLEFVQWNMA